MESGPACSCHSGPLKPNPNIPASSVPPCGMLGKFNSINRSDNSLTGFELVFETSSFIVSLSSCLLYAQEMRPQGRVRSTVLVFLVGVALGEEERGRSVS